VATDGTIRVGVVGLGAFGSHHARHYAAHPAARLVAVVDADPARVCAAAEKYGAEALGDHRGLIGKVDAVSITVPASLHHAVASDLIAAGIHLFIEKPIAADAKEAAELISQAEKTGVLLQIGHIERFSPAFRELQKGVGQPRLVEAIRHSPWNGRSTDVDVVLDLMIHDIDLALALIGEPVTSVEATGTAVKTAHNDIANATLRFANGAVAKLSASRVADKPTRTLSVEEPGRAYTADLGAPSLSVTAGGSTGTIPVEPADNLGAEIAAFLDSVATGSPPLVDGRAGLAAVAVAEMILAAISPTRASPSPNGDSDR
jgi:predicted dehydrogenase